MARGRTGPGRRDNRAVTHLRAHVTRWADDAFPGWVEITFRQADGQMVTVIEKAPVVDSENRLTAETLYPVPLRLSCRVVHIDSAESPVATVELSHRSADLEGKNQFRVPLDLLGDLPVDLEGG